MITLMAMSFIIGSLTNFFLFPQLIVFAAAFGIYTRSLMLTMKKFTAK